MYEINQERQLELLRRLLFAWDAQWFLKSAAAFGPDEALKVNARVRAAYGRLEMKAMLALIGQEQAANLADSLEVIKTYHQIAFSHNPILSGTHLVASDTNGNRGKALVALARCVALDNAKRSALPVSPSDTNCIYCQMLWTTWFENLLPDAQIEVVFEAQSMQGAPHGVLTVTCYRATSSTAATFETPAVPAYNPFMPPPTNNIATPAAVYPDVPPVTPVAPSPNSPYYAQNLPVAPSSDLPSYYAQSLPFVPSPDLPSADLSYPPAYPPSEPIPSSYVNAEASYPPPLPVAPPPAAPLIGGNEVATPATNRAAAPSGSLRQRLQQNRDAAQSNVSNIGKQAASPLNSPVSKANSDEPMLVPTTHIDPVTGRPLFSGDMERLIDSGVKNTKKRSLNLISRVMLSKEAQQLLKESADNPTPPVVPMTLANSIDTILQRLLIAEQNERPGYVSGVVRVSNRPNGDLQIQIGSNYYDSVEAVPPSRIKDLLQQAVSLWYETQ